MAGEIIEAGIGYFFKAIQPVQLTQFSLIPSLIVSISALPFSETVEAVSVRSKVMISLGNFKIADSFNGKVSARFILLEEPSQPASTESTEFLPGTKD